MIFGEFFLVGLFEATTNAGMFTKEEKKTSENQSNLFNPSSTFFPLGFHQSNILTL